MAIFKPNGNFAKTFYTPSGMNGRWLKVQGDRVAFVSRAIVGVDTGKLKKSIKAGKVTKAGPTDLEIEVTADARRRGQVTSYALVHHNGSRPHVIMAKPGSALHWGGRTGPTVVAVHHPGTRGNPYLLKALNIVIGGMH